MTATATRTGPPAARRWTAGDGAAVIDLGHLTGTSGRTARRKDGGSCDGWRLRVRRADNGAELSVTYLGETPDWDALAKSLKDIGAVPDITRRSKR